MSTQPTAPGPVAFPRTEVTLKVAGFFLNVLTVVAVLTGAWLGYQDYSAKVTHQEEQQKAELAQRVKDYKVKFYEQQMRVYLDVCDAAAKLATARDAQRYGEARRRFEELYWGQALAVEDAEVEEAMERIYRKICSGTPRRSELRELAFDLTQACARSLERSFDVQGVGTSKKYGQLPAGPEE